MEVSVTKKISPTAEITIKFDDERDLKEAFLKATPFLQIDTCSKSGNDNIIIQARKTKDDKGAEFIYLELYCKTCHDKKSFGEYLSPKGALFLKGDWEVWKKEAPKEQS